MSFLVPSMRTSSILMAVAIAVTPAFAGDISVKLDDVQQQQIANLPILVDQCVAGVMMHGDANVCRNLSGFLAWLAASAQAARDQPKTKPPADTPPPP